MIRGSRLVAGLYLKAQAVVRSRQGHAGDQSSREACQPSAERIAQPYGEDLQLVRALRVE